MVQRTLIATPLALIAASCALLLAPSAAGAQRADTTMTLPGGPGVIVGMVIDTAGNPVEAAEVTVGIVTVSVLGYAMLLPAYWSHVYNATASLRFLPAVRT